MVTKRASTTFADALVTQDEASLQAVRRITKANLKQGQHSASLEHAPQIKHHRKVFARTLPSTPLFLLLLLACKGGEEP